MTEVSRLQALMGELLAAQADQVNRIFEDASTTVVSAAAGNRELDKSTRNQAFMQKAILVILLFMCLLLILVHNFN